MENIAVSFFPCPETKPLFLSYLLEIMRIRQKTQNGKYAMQMPLTDGRLACSLTRKVPYLILSVCREGEQRFDLVFFALIAFILLARSKRLCRLLRAEKEWQRMTFKVARTFHLKV